MSLSPLFHVIYLHSIQGGTLIKIIYLGSNFFSRQVLGDLPTYVIRHIAIYGNMTSCTFRSELINTSHRPNFWVLYANPSIQGGFWLHKCQNRPILLLLHIFVVSPLCLNAWLRPSMLFIQVSNSALDLGTAVRTYSKSFIVYGYIMVGIISVILKPNININTSSMFQTVALNEF